MKSLQVFSIFIILLVYWNDCQSNLQSKYNPSKDIDMDSFKVSEWRRYLTFHRKKMKETLSGIKRYIRNKIRKPTSDEKRVAPNFMLSRTQEGFVVKQLEPGTKSFSKGGFEFPNEPALMINMNFKYDGSVAPVVKLSETKKGVVSKRLEFGIAQNPGINWHVRSGSAKSKNLKNKAEITENGEIVEVAGINQDFPTGSLSLRGTLKLLNSSMDLNIDEIKEIEPLPMDENYDIEIEQYKNEDASFETVDGYYEDRDTNNDNNDDNNFEEENNWGG